MVVSSTTLVPTLTVAFDLTLQSDINLDPIVLAVACFIYDDEVTVDQMLVKGREWFPTRSISSIKSEGSRMKRFAATYPNVFTFNTLDATISLKHDALSCESNARSGDEEWYRIALHRIEKHDMDIVLRIINELDVRRDQTVPYLSILN